MGSNRRTRMYPPSAMLLAVLASSILGGCATYSDRILAASQAAAGGDYSTAVTSLNQVLGVESAASLPSEWKADRALAALERGVLLQSLEQYGDAARDISAAEGEIEIIDLSRDPVGTLGAYIYSDSAKAYAALPSERLALNPFNLLNYLAQGDLNGAATEARRFQVIRDFLDAEGIEDHGAAPYGAYLAGFVFEALGEGDRALRYYDTALAGGALESLRRPAARLAAVNPYRGTNLEEFLAAPAAVGEVAGGGELLVVLHVGRVPHKVPERLPVGVAVGLIGAELSRDLRWLSRGAGKVIVYPKLVDTPSRLGSPLLRVNGRPVELESLVDLSAVVRREYKDIEPKIIAAALTRLAARAAVSEGVRQAGSQEGDVLGEVLGLLVEGLFVAFDRPDTRSWTMMPATVLVARVQVAPGENVVEVDFAGVPAASRRTTVAVSAGAYRAVVVTEPR